MIVLHALLATVLSYNYYCMYKTTTNTNDLTKKQKAYVLSIKSAVTLFVLSLIFVRHFIKCGYDADLYVEKTCDTVDFLQQAAITAFLAHLIVDSVVGSKDYPKYMKTLSGYPHHFVYIIVSLIALLTKQHAVLALFMFEELPTALLGIGCYDEKLRNDMLFGATFFLTRIMFHIYITYKFRNNTLVRIVGGGVIPLHMYWFYTWVKKYSGLQRNNLDSKVS